MKRIRQIVAIMALITTLTSASSSWADDVSLREVLQDALYGVGIGALVGGALMVFTKKPADHLDYIAYGAASGILAGTAYGLAKSARPLAELENGKVKFAVPTIMPDLVESPSTRQTTVMWHAKILQGTFN